MSFFIVDILEEKWSNFCPGRKTNHRETCGGTVAARWNHCHPTDYASWMEKSLP
jgi:hypothetical protein